MMNDRESFYTAIGPTIKVAQYFGILPISGVVNKSPNMMEFKIKSFRTFWTVIIIIALVLIEITFIIAALRTLAIEASSVIGLISALVFFGNASIGLILFLRLSPKWINLSQKWETMENELDRLCFDVKSLEIRSKIRRISIIFTSIAVFEHSLYVINESINNGFPNYMSSLYNFLLSTYHIDEVKFSFTNYNSTFIMSIFVRIFDNCAAVIFNFTDLFIILITTGIAERINWLNNRVKYLCSQKRRAVPWYQLRKNYAVLGDLVKQTNNNISSLIFLSCVTNLYFTWFGLFKEIALDKTGLFEKIHFFVSYCYHVGKLIAVTFSASRVNVKSKEALPVIYLCKSSNFTVETKRLQHQLTSDNIVFTGMNFFSITRNFMLVTAGTLATYELILVQFHGQADK